MSNVSVRNRVQMFEHRTSTPTGSETSQGGAPNRRSSDGWSNSNHFPVANSPKVVNGKARGSLVVSGGSASRRPSNHPFEPFEQGSATVVSRHGKLEWPLDDEEDIAREIANVPVIKLSRPSPKKSSAQKQKQPIVWKQQLRPQQPPTTHKAQGEKFGKGAPSPFMNIVTDNFVQKSGASSMAWPPAKKQVEQRDEKSSSLTPIDSENEEPRNTKMSKGEMEASRSTRMMWSKKSGSPLASNESSGLKQSLDAASVVLEEEKSNAGSSNASSRSSLSNQELSNIAKRALKLSKGSANTRSNNASVPQHQNEKSMKQYQEKNMKEENLTSSKKDSSISKTEANDNSSTISENSRSPNPKIRTTLVSAARRTKSVTGISHQEARKALQNAAQRKKEMQEAMDIPIQKTDDLKEEQERYDPTKRVMEDDKSKDQDGDNGIKDTISGTKLSTGLVTLTPYEGPSARLGSRASRVLALKNSVKANGTKTSQDDGMESEYSPSASIHGNHMTSRNDASDDASVAFSVNSFDSKSRRLQHPALASRRPKKATNRKPFSEEIMSSMRQFTASKDQAHGSPAAAVDRNAVTSLSNSVSPSSRTRDSTTMALGSIGSKSALNEGTNIGKSTTTLRDALKSGQRSMTKLMGQSNLSDAVHSSENSRGFSKPSYSMPDRHDDNLGKETLQYTNSMDHRRLSPPGSRADPENTQLDQKFNKPSINTSAFDYSKNSLEKGNPYESPSMARSPGPPGRAPRNSSDFDYLVRHPSRQSGVDADPVICMTDQRGAIRRHQDTQSPSKDVDRSELNESPPGFARAPHGDDDNKIQTGMDPDPIGDSFLIPESGRSSQSDDVSYNDELEHGDLKVDSYSIEDRSQGKGGTENSRHTKGSVGSSQKSGASSLKSGISGIHSATETKSVKNKQPHYSTQGDKDQFRNDGVLPGSSESSSESEKASRFESSKKEGEGESKTNSQPEMTANKNQSSEHVRPARNRGRTKSDMEASASGRRSRSELKKENKSEDETHKEYSTLLGASTLNTSQSGTFDPSKSLSLTLNTESNRSDERLNSGEQPEYSSSKPSSNENSQPTTVSSGQPQEQTSNLDTKLNDVQTSSKSEGQRWWKNKYGLKMSKSVNEVIKNAFKSSPRNPLGVTQPSPHGMIEGKSFSIDEDDIFGGLEEDNGSKEGARYSAKQPSSKDVAEKNVKANEKVESAHQSPKKESISNLRYIDGSPIISGARAAESIHSNDRSGTVLDESEVLNDVNSDITSSLVGGAPTNWTKSNTPKPLLGDTDLQAANSEHSNADEQLAPGSNPNESSKEKPPTRQEDNEQTSVTDSVKVGDNPKPQTSTKSTKGAKKSKAPKEQKSKKSPNASKTKKKSDTKIKESKKGEAAPLTEDDETLGGSMTSGAPPPQGSSMFLNIGCGIVDSFTNGGVCTFSKKDAVNTAEDGTGASLVSAASSADTGSRLTDLEKRVWNDWDRRDTGTAKKWNSDNSVDNKEDHDKKRQVARGKLLDYASSAISSQMISGSVMTSTMTLPRLQQDSSEYTDCSSSTGDSGDSSLGGNESKDTASYSDQSDASDDRPAPPKVDVGKPMPTTPILLSFSQRSLVEKFTKNLAMDGVEVLKLNRRKQWQLRYFTVSKERIPLAAHETKPHSGDVAQCPKALLWLKKFNPKNGGYALTNIDKNGHGGMMLVELTDVTVTSKEDTDNPIPKKLLDKFGQSVLVTLDYTMNGGFRSVSFRCKTNDEAQFLCTCMRVIRDLLKREQFLRLRTPAFVKGSSLKVQT